MRLTMTMMRPVIFPDLDPSGVLSHRKTAGIAEAMQAYGEALLDCNIPCMEASESVAEVENDVNEYDFTIEIPEEIVDMAK